jgi:hypothetical protein
LWKLRPEGYIHVNGAVLDFQQDHYNLNESRYAEPSFKHSVEYNPAQDRSWPLSFLYHK